MKKLDAIMEETTKTGSAIKKQLDEIKAADEAWKAKYPSSATTQMRTNLYTVSGAAAAAATGQAALHARVPCRPTSASFTRR